MKQYKNSKGEDLPKEINEVVNAESKRLGAYENSDKLSHAFEWDSSNYFKENNDEYWQNVDSGDYLQFYLEYKFKNAKGQIFPDEIQNEIYEEIKANYNGSKIMLPFRFVSTKKGSNYWSNLYQESDYSQPTEPAIFIPNSGDMVEVSDDGKDWRERKFKFYDKVTTLYVCSPPNPKVYTSWLFCRPIKTKVTIAELLECYATAKGLKVDNLEQI